MKGPGPIIGRRAKYFLLLFWLAVAMVASLWSGKLTGAENNDATAFLPVHAESTLVLDAQQSFQSPNLLPAVVVFERRSGLTESDRAKVAQDAKAFATVAPTDGAVSGPVFSGDGQAAEVVVPFDLGSNGWQRASHVVDRVMSIASGTPGLDVQVTGPAGYAAASGDVFRGIDTTLLLGTVLIVILILLLTYRSPLLWILPVLSSGVALVAAEAVIYLLAAHAGLTVNAMSVGILTVLVFGAGTDYALLLVARYREELRLHEDRHQAMSKALRRAAPAIVASASTVILGLMCLVLAESNASRGLGPVAAIGVAVAMLTMLSLLPALLVVAGRWIFWPAVPRSGSSEPTLTGPWAKVASAIGRRPRPVWIVAAAALALMAAGMTTLHATGLTNRQSYRGTPAAVVGEDVLARHFPGGVGSPVIVLADASSFAPVQRALRTTPGVAAVSPPLFANGRVFLQGTLASAPDSSTAYEVVDQLRTRLHAISGAHALVGGATAVNLDAQRAAAHDRYLIIPIVLLVVILILALLLRAVLAPLVLIATVVLSFFAALGVSALFYTHVFGFAGADSALPLYAFVFLVALGIDYNIFLMTRVREEARREGTGVGSLRALAATGGVITSAGFVLAGTFAMMATLPLTTFTEIGFAVAFGVLLDTIVVRSVLVTSLNLELGDRIWWPSRLRKGPERYGEVRELRGVVERGGEGVGDDWQNRQAGRR